MSLILQLNFVHFVDKESAPAGSDNLLTSNLTVSSEHTHADDKQEAAQIDDS